MADCTRCGRSLYLQPSAATLCDQCAPSVSDHFADDDPMLPATRPCRDRVRSALGTLLAAVVILGVMLAFGYFLGEGLHG